MLYKDGAPIAGMDMVSGDAAVPIVEGNPIGLTPSGGEAVNGETHFGLHFTESITEPGEYSLEMRYDGELFFAPPEQVMPK